MQAVIQYIEKELSGLYPANEITGFTRLIFEHVCGWDYTRFLANRNTILSSSEKGAVKQIVERLKTFEPVQYILGETEFYGLRLKVNPAVLIPRPETEELVEWIVKSNRTESPAILDIGTGSGCIALALKKELPRANIAATDISEKALQTARENAEANRLLVDFFQADILHWENHTWKTFDMVVSNPPYVREMEKEKMHPNVLEFEPARALFVPDANPLIFYRKISELALKHLNPGGYLFFEINEHLGAEMKKLLAGLGFKNICIKKDIHEKERMIQCQK